MDKDDQARYIADLVLGAEKVLISAGKPDKASAVEKFFTEVKQGDTNSLGMAEYEINLAKARLADARRREKDPNAKRLEVEDAMAVTLQKNDIELPDSFFTVLSDFRPKLPPKK
jgi:hypothetical protein